MEKKKQKGGQPHNSNAKGKHKHSFYSRVLNEALSYQLDEAVIVEGLDQEIALFRIKLRELLEKHPERFDQAISCSNALTSMIRTKYKISAGQKKSLKDAITKVLTEIAVPLGIKAIIQ